MAIPDFQSVMLPLLRLIADGKEHRIGHLYDQVADSFNLSDAERTELLSSGKQPVLNNRVAWAKTYLLKAGLLESPRRGYIVITDRGREILEKNLSELNTAYLNQYPEFVEFRTASRPDNECDDTGDGERNSKTPEERMEAAYAQIRDSLAQDVLALVKASTPAFFERIVLNLLLAMGYGGSLESAGRVTGRSGDEGIDGIIQEDRLGLDVIYLQAKRWENVVSRPEIQKFVGALQGQRAKKGVFVTTSTFSNEAKEYAKRIDNRVVLIDGKRMAELMIEFDIGVSKANAFQIKRIDSDYFLED